MSKRTPPVITYFIPGLIRQVAKVSLSGTLDSEGQLALTVEMTNAGKKPCRFGFNCVIEVHLRLYNLDGSRVDTRCYLGAKEDVIEIRLLPGASFSVTLLGQVTPESVDFYHTEPRIMDGEETTRYQTHNPINGQPVEIEFDLYGVKSNRLTLDPVLLTLSPVLEI